MPAGSALTHEKILTPSRDFLIWSRYGDSGKIARGTYLLGTRERERERRLQEAYYFPFCQNRSVKKLAEAATSTAPRHVRSEVARYIFGGEMDASETAEAADGHGSSGDQNRLERRRVDPAQANALLERLTQPSAPATPASRPSTAWAGESAAYISVEPLNVHCKRVEVSQRRVGASRPTRVQPRPQSAQATLQAVRYSDAYKAELDKVTRARINAHLNRPSKNPGHRGAAVKECFYSP